MGWQVMAALVAGVLTIIATGLWLWMAWANKRGRPWARIMATVFFGLLTAIGLAWLIAVLGGTFNHTALVLGVSFFLVYWLAGLRAVILLWQRSSSDYYTAARKRSKATRAASREPRDQPAVR
jgi:hypothetical protein